MMKQDAELDTTTTLSERELDAVQGGVIRLRREPPPPILPPEPEPDFRPRRDLLGHPVPDAILPASR